MVYKNSHKQRWFKTLLTKQTPIFKAGAKRTDFLVNEPELLQQLCQFGHNFRIFDQINSPFFSIYSCRKINELDAEIQI